MEKKKNTIDELKDVLMGKNQEGKKGEKEDVEKNKPMAIIGYLIPFLFFVPLLNEESNKSPFAKFHANQQLILLIFWFGSGTIAKILTMLWVGYPLLLLILIASFALMIMGIINATNGEMKKLPIIGDFEILK